MARRRELPEDWSQGVMMRITRRQLRRVIKEAASLLLEYERYVYRNQDGELRISDDDGNDEPADHLEGQYGHLEAGGEGETIFGTGGGGGRGGYGGNVGVPRSRNRRRRDRWL